MATETVKPARTLPLPRWSLGVLALIAVVVAVLRKCLCGALLPPCPDPEMADCVPIATVTVERGQCRVRQVCNLSNRRFLVTFPTLEYWLSWLPASKRLRKTSARKPSLESSNWSPNCAATIPRNRSTSPGSKRAVMKRELLHPCPREGPPERSSRRRGRGAARRRVALLRSPCPGNTRRSTAEV